MTPTLEEKARGKLKRCPRCHESKPLSQYHNSRWHHDGLATYCKPCMLARQKAFREKSPLYAAYRPKRAERLKEKRKDGRYKERDKRNARISRERFPEKAAARAALNRAIKSETIQKPHKCQDCAKETNALHGHHEDYAKPLDVVWLCVPCHHARHYPHPHSALTPSKAGGDG